MKITLCFIVTCFSAFAEINAEKTSIKITLSDNTDISKAVQLFNSSADKWLKSKGVHPLTEDEILNGLALGAHHLSREKPLLSVLARNSYSKKILPSSTSIILKKGEWVEKSPNENQLRPFLYIYVSITTLTKKELSENVPSDAEVAATAFLPVRMAVLP